ncbi:type II toxin-antitoxin system VapC family toxin [candidate division KSB1 bacterium]|nr:type II toxin-antitoxin system VapC family toxin [candidate division KSB1 bacterium]NIV69420.1 PIN domain-containing protein [Phycisphaerae bacterium]NIR70718.1 type II toxin-antitoxin system VapC family toxin [candidate division KSB1 bacterium]NIS27775.1 type II toxin-antitoxin system VapC family toxin [candidate division KSB1 bacterium]NIT74623.1 type II toxin-antitoxin system VapC family toxin [candidate division KSB1 bacterium]
MKETVYIETSVVSYYTSNPSRDLVIAARQEITRQKWPEILKSFELHISALVIQEAEQGDAEASEKRLAAISKMPVLPISDEAESLASLLIGNGPIPEQYPEDALHIAVATINGMDYLLTWNFTHINNAQMKAKIISVVEAEGYQCPTICSPEELLGE